MGDYIGSLTNVVPKSSAGHIQPLYCIGLEESLPQLIVDHLPGYRDHAPVRIGNHA